MLIVTDISQIPQDNKPAVLAMGCFDGVHLGHQKVISTAVEQAQQLGGEAWVYTFDPHPAKVLVPDKAPPLISAEPSRLRQIEALGVAGIIQTPFTREFAGLEPEEFLNDLAAKAPSLKGVVCGEDWSFGRRAAGNVQTLKAFGKTHGFTVTAVAPLMDGEQKISSSTIRKLISGGNIPEASRLLGRPFSLFGSVVEGRKIGRELGFPTANIEPLNELLPAHGIYAAWTRIQRTENREQGTEPNPSSVFRHPPPGLPSAVFAGASKTFDFKQSLIESYLLDFDGDLYGKDIEIVLLEKIRDVHSFPSREALIEQIGKDVARIRAVLTA